MSAEDHHGSGIGLTGARFGGASRRRRRRDEVPVAPPRTAPSEAATEIIRAVTGPAPRPPDRAPDVVPGEGPGVGLTGARFGGASRRRRGAVPPPVAEPAPQPAPATQPAPVADVPPLVSLVSEALDPSATSFVRPYVLTRGRTRSLLDLSIETLVSAVPAAAPVAEDQQAVVDLCREPRSVAEVAALLAVPIGVARVLLGDLAACGALTVHRTAGAAGPDLALMERVLTGLRRL